MDSSNDKLRPAFNFINQASNVVLNQGPVEICIENMIYKGNGEVRLELLFRNELTYMVRFEKFQRLTYYFSQWAARKFQAFQSITVK